MPELPEVETVRRALAPVLTGRAVDSVRVNRRDLRFPLPAGFAERLTGRRFAAVTRRGKYIVLGLDSGESMILHLGMSGRVKLFGHIQDYTPEAHDHFYLVLEGGGMLVYKDPRRFGFVLLREDGGWQQEKPFSVMGPEPLGDDFNGPLLARRLAGRKTSIKQALLDQKVVAGIGNIYACEALYEARISPKRKACTVRGLRAARLANAMQSVLQRAIAAGGSSLRDYHRTDGTMGYFQYGFSVYDREGHACPDCANGSGRSKGIKRISQAGRSTFYCSVCQR